MEVPNPKKEERESDYGSYGHYDENEMGNYTYDYDGEYDYAGDYNDTDEYYNENAKDSSNGTSCMEQPIEKEHHMVALFCDYMIIEVRKCCDKNHNLNLR